MGYLEWALLPYWADDPDDIPRPINTRSETVPEKPMFRDAFEQRRCLLLAGGFYE
jgi:putative SOS response-associated peptidase YedK